MPCQGQQMAVLFQGTVRGMKKAATKEKEAPAHPAREIARQAVKTLMARSTDPELKKAKTLAIRAGIGRRTLNRVLNGKNSTVDTIGAIADAFGVEVWQLFIPGRNPLVQGKNHTHRT